MKLGWKWYRKPTQLSSLIGRGKIGMGRELWADHGRYNEPPLMAQHEPMDSTGLAEHYPRIELSCLG